MINILKNKKDIYLYFITGFILTVLFVFAIVMTGKVTDIYEFSINMIISYFLMFIVILCFIKSRYYYVASGFFLMFLKSFFEGIEELSFFAQEGFIDRTEDFTEDYLVVLSIFIISSGFIKHMNKQHETIGQLTKNCNLDPLTNVLNRRAFCEIFEGCNLDTSSSFCFIDLDGFKCINDLFGHDIGDRVLLDFCRVVENQKRGNDYLFRLGGDEFLLVVDNNDISKVEYIINRIKKSLSMINAEYTIDFSYGIEIAAGHIDTEKILAQSDSKMYFQKKNKKCRCPVL